MALRLSTSTPARVGGTVTTVEKPVGLLSVDLKVNVKFSSAFVSKYNKESKNNKLSNEWINATLGTITGVKFPALALLDSPSLPEDQKKNSGSLHVRVWKESTYRNSKGRKVHHTTSVLSANFKHITEIDMRNKRFVVQTHCPDGCSCGKVSPQKEGSFEVKDIALAEMKYIKKVCDEMGHAYTYAWVWDTTT